MPDGNRYRDAGQCGESRIPLERHRRRKLSLRFNTSHSTLLGLRPVKKSSEVVIPAFAGLTMLFFAMTVHAANWYVRPGGVGSKNGTDWNNAWNSGGTGGINWSSVN